MKKIKPMNFEVYREYWAGELMNDGHRISVKMPYSILIVPVYDSVEEFDAFEEMERQMYKDLAKVKSKKKYSEKFTEVDSVKYGIINASVEQTNVEGVFSIEVLLNNTQRRTLFGFASSPELAFEIGQKLSISAVQTVVVRDNKLNVIELKENI